MTDLEKFIELYKSFGVECIVQEEVSQKGDFYSGGAVESGAY